MTLDPARSTALLDLLRQQSGEPDLDFAREPVAMTGGYWAELFAFTLSRTPAGWPADLVVRYMPDPTIGHKETAIQTVVADAGFPTPRVRAAGASAPDGMPMMVMDRAPGGPLLAGLDGARSIIAGVRLANRLPGLLATAMADLHALDPQPARDRLRSTGLAVTLGPLLDSLTEWTHRVGRPDLTSAARWLLTHQPASGPDVVCHGDLHPLNLLMDGDAFTLIDWSAALIAPRAYDVAFTSLLLQEPPLVVPAGMRPTVRLIGSRMARRFVGAYAQRAGVAVGEDELRWHQGLVCLRALVEVAGWQRDGLLARRAGHPWLICGPAFAERLGALTGAGVAPR